MEGKTNTIVICSDEHHYNFLGYRGHKYVQTPNLDLLAEQGTSFNNCYCTSPVCTPSRMSFITGKHVHQIENWFIGVALDENEHTWASRLSEAGVESTMIGKMDFCGAYQSGGFDQYRIIDRRGAFSPYPRQSPLKARLKDYQRSDKLRHIKQSGIRRPLVTNGSDAYHDALGFYDHDRYVTQWAKEYLETKRGQREPWVLYLGYVFPHWPFTCPEKYFNIYYPDKVELPFDCIMPENPNLHPAIREFQKSCNFADVTEDDIRRTIAAYCGMITCMDDMIGEVFDTMRELGIYDSTTIIYTSDHGENCGEHGLFYKQCPYNGATAVPLIVKGPDVSVGHVVDTPVSLIDLYPTLLKRYGLEVEEDRPGKSWDQLLRGESNYDSEFVFAEFHGNFFRNSWYMIVKGCFKYVYYVNDRPSLFDLNADPHELTDLAGSVEHEDILKDFEQLLRSQLNPEEIDWRSKKDLGLISPDGKDLTMTMTVSECEQLIREGQIPFQDDFETYTDYFDEH